MLGKLINLEILNLNNCEFEILPVDVGGIGGLKQLKEYLKLLKPKYNCIWCYITLMGEFVILGSFDNWEAEDGEKDVAPFFELNGLKNIIILKLEIKNSSVVLRKKPLWIQKMKKYSINVSKCSSNSESERH